jgi:hypothetical protein
MNSELQNDVVSKFDKIFISHSTWVKHTLPANTLPILQLRYSTIKTNTETTKKLKRKVKESNKKQQGRL